MISFFIIDATLMGDAEIKKVLKCGKPSKILLRNRADKSFSNTYNVKNYYATPNLKSLRATNAKGLHLSLFHNKLISKIPLRAGISSKTVGAHNLKEILKACKIFKPQYIFISPIAETKTHREARTLSRVELFKIINKTNLHNFILLGGMNFKRTNQIKRLDTNKRIKGFAGINGFITPK